MMKPTLKTAALGAAFFLLQSCSSFDFPDAMLTGLCVASEASCLKSCAVDYDDSGSAFSYDDCSASCQPGGGSCD